MRAGRADSRRRRPGRRLAREPLFIADALVCTGRAEGCVAGAVRTTAEVLRAAIWLIGPAAGVRTISSAFYMEVGAFRGERGGAHLHRLRRGPTSPVRSSSPTSRSPRRVTELASSVTSRV